MNRFIGNIYIYTHVNCQDDILNGYTVWNDENTTKLLTTICCCYFSNFSCRKIVFETKLWQLYFKKIIRVSTDTENKSLANKGTVWNSIVSHMIGCVRAFHDNTQTYSTTVEANVVYPVYWW